MPIRPSILKWVVPTNKNILLLDNHSITIKLRKLTLTHYCLLILISVHVLPIVSIISSILKESHITFVYHVFLVSFPLDLFVSLTLTFMILTFLKITGYLFYKSSQLRFFEVFFSWLDLGCIWQEYHRNDTDTFSLLVIKFVRSFF